LPPILVNNREQQNNRGQTTITASTPLFPNFRTLLFVTHPVFLFGHNQPIQIGTGRYSPVIAVRWRAPFGIRRAKARWNTLEFQ
jgi:hypothetical protein